VALALPLPPEFFEYSLFMMCFKWGIQITTKVWTAFIVNMDRFGDLFPSLFQAVEPGLDK
jgi:hypothetical protein